MKYLLILISIVFFSGLTKAQNIEFENFDLRQSLPDWLIFSTGQIKCDKSLIVTGRLNPFYLESDFNGDSVLDIALCVQEKNTKKNGILIIHGKTLETFIIGAGNKFAHVGDDFKFLEIWKVYRERIVGLTTFSEDGDILGTEDIKIDNDAITVSKSESPSNIIAWQSNKYVWLHTGD